jgi:Domain of unknown function (DUF4055)
MSLWGAVKDWLSLPDPMGGGVNSPAAQSPVVKSWQANISLVRAIFGGFQTLYEKRQIYLPQHPAEDGQDYYIRSNRPTFYNAFARTVRALSGIVFRTPPTPEGVPSEILDLYEDDIDNEGTDGPSFLKGVFQDGLITGLAGIFVNQQTLAAAGTRADELAAGIRPYWELIPMDAIVSFRPTVEAGKILLAQLVFCEYRQIPDGAYGVKVIEQWRVYRRTPAGPVGDSGDTLPAFVTEELIRKNERGQYVTISARLMPVVEEIPFAAIYTDRVGFLNARPPMLDLANTNLLHYQTSSDLFHAAHIANVPFLFGGGFDSEKLQIGPNRAIILPGLKRDEGWLQWMETTGASLGSTRAILSDLEEQMSNLGLGMLQRKSRAAQTAEKASLDKQEQDSTLAGIVGDLEDGIERALFYTSQYLQLSTWGRLTFSRDFQTDALGATPTEGQGEPKPPKDPAAPGVTNNPKTSA